jgi:hypothetical protein
VQLEMKFMLNLSAEDEHITVCGDVHGQYYDVLNIFEMNGPLTSLHAPMRTHLILPAHGRILAQKSYRLVSSTEPTSSTNRSDH